MDVVLTLPFHVSVAFCPQSLLVKRVLSEFSAVLVSLPMAAAVYLLRTSSAQGWLSGWQVGGPVFLWALGISGVFCSKNCLQPFKVEILPRRGRISRTGANARSENPTSWQIYPPTKKGVATNSQLRKFVRTTNYF